MWPWRPLGPWSEAEAAHSCMKASVCATHPQRGGRGGRAGPSEDLVKKRQGTRALKAAQRLSIYWSVCFFPFLP